MQQQQVYIIPAGNAAPTASTGGAISQETQIARAAGQSGLSVLDPESSVGQVGNGVNQLNSPDRQIRGTVAVPKKMRVARYEKFCIDTRGLDSSETQVAYLFDALTYFKSTVNCGACRTAKNVVDNIYSGTGPDCSSYPAVLNELQAGFRIIDSVKITATSGFDSDNNKVEADLFGTSIKVYRTNSLSNQQIDFIEPEDSFDSDTRNTNTVTIPLSGPSSRLDGNTTWELNLKAGLKYTFQFYVAVSN